MFIKNNLLSICFELSQTEGCCFLSWFAKLLRWMAVGDCAHMSMFTPISDSSEAVGHLILSVEPRPSLHTGSKVHPFPQGPHHVLTTSWFSKQHEKSRPVRWDTTKKRKKKREDGTQVFCHGPVLPVRCLLTLWLGGLGDGAAEWSRSGLPASSYRRNWLFWKLIKLRHN